MAELTLIIWSFVVIISVTKISIHMMMVLVGLTVSSIGMEGMLMMLMIPSVFRLRVRYRLAHLTNATITGNILTIPIASHDEHFIQGRKFQSSIDGTPCYVDTFSEK